MCKSKLNIVNSATLRILLLLAVLLSAGCAVKFVYNQLDWAIPWYLSDYMSLNSHQEKEFKKRLDSYLKWHRKTQLPLYADFLTQVAKDLETGMTEAKLEYIQQQTEVLGQALIERLVPDMAVLFQAASDKQIKALFKKFKEDNESYREEYIEASERAQRKRRAKEVEDYVERWTGRLNKEQRGLIRQGTDQYLLMGEEFLQARIAWQDEFYRILSFREDKDRFEKAFAHLLLTYDFGQSEAFARKLAHNQKVLRAMYLELDKSLSARQRQHAIKKLLDYAEDFRELAEQN